jgi:hypothetical protein
MGPTGYPIARRTRCLTFVSSAVLDGAAGHGYASPRGCPCASRAPDPTDLRQQGFLTRRSALRGEANRKPRVAWRVAPDPRGNGEGSQPGHARVLARPAPAQPLMLHAEVRRAEQESRPELHGVPDADTFRVGEDRHRGGLSAVGTRHHTGEDRRRRSIYMYPLAHLGGVSDTSGSVSCADTHASGPDPKDGAFHFTTTGSVAGRLAENSSSKPSTRE